ncbi:unnamed protein product [Lasius platythorax]|uniref:Uncharacterized protein n=1 Tax=Lasius platythorax TaxID=488582 RepID=A0AAV2MZN5_9HYME
MIYLHCPPNTINECIKTINEEIAAIVSWAESNNLLLNNANTKAMIVGSSRYLNAMRSVNMSVIQVGNDPVFFSKSIKYLGIIITNTLDWNEQVTDSVKRINTTLYRLKACKKHLPTTVRATLVTSLINPILDYACLVYRDLTCEQNTKLQRAYNSCIRMIFDVRKDAHITPFYSELNWLKVNDRREYFLGTFMYRLLHTERPKYLFDCFTFRSQTDVRTTRVSYQVLILPTCRTETFKKSFEYSAAEFWNELPKQIRESPNLALFRTTLYKQLVERHAHGCLF